MTLETFNKLIDGGYITNVGTIEYYKNNLDELKKKTIVEFAHEGVISKQIVDFDYDKDDLVNEEEAVAPTPTVDTKSVKDEEVVAPVEVKSTAVEPEPTDEPNEVEIENDVKSDEIEVETEDEE